MRSLVALITLVLVAGNAVAHATEMVEVPNPPPYMPPREPTPSEKKHDEGVMMLVGGLALAAGGLGIEAGAVVYAVDNPCILPLYCIFGPPHEGEFMTFMGLVTSGAIATAGGITLTVFGGSQMRKARKAELKLHATGTGLSLSGRF